MDFNGDCRPFRAVVDRCEPADREIAAESGRRVLCRACDRQAVVRVDQALVRHGEQERVVWQPVVPERLVVLRRTRMGRGQCRVADPQQAGDEAVAHGCTDVGDADFLPDGEACETDVFIRHRPGRDPVAVLDAEDLIGDFFIAGTLGGIVGLGPV